MLIKKQLLTIVFAASFFTSLLSQSPRNISTDIEWDEDAITSGTQQTYADKTAIENAFNNARRAEEGQFVPPLTSGILGTLTLPSNFLSLSPDEQALIIINAERSCRGGVNYGDGVCKGWVFEGIETTVDGVAQTYVDLMISSNCAGHFCGGGDPFTRISNGVGASCLEFINRGENIASFYTSGSSNPLVVSRACYGWIYKDASSMWGHREACLLQDRDLTGNIIYGFDDNHGAVGVEGFIGIGTAGANNGAYYAPYATKPVWLNRADVVVLNFFDPVATGCTYILPVELLSFDAKAKQNGIELTWTTAEEINLEGYEIERSEDGVNFKTIDFVASKGKNKAEKADYLFLDPSVKPHLVYFYRLQMVDYDGKSKHSPMRSAILRGSKTGVSDYRLSPNLSKGMLSVENLAYESREWTIQLFDISGKLILATKTNVDAGAKQDLALPNMLNSGLYLVRIADAQFSKTEKVVFAN